MCYHLTLTIVSLMFVFAPVFSENPYCKANCQYPGGHLLCKYEPCQVKCPHSSFKEPDNTFRDSFLHFLNDMRRRVASGYLGLPEASNMRALSWDRELEFIAQCLLNSCIYEMALGLEPECKITMQKGDLVHTIRKETKLLTERNSSGNVTFKTIMQSWIPGKEITKQIDSFPSDASEEYREFAQLIWADTTHVGCGQRTYPESKTHTRTITFCNFAPEGLRVNESIYKRGKSCTSGGLQENPTYKGLCDRIRPLEEDHFVPPFEISHEYSRSKSSSNATNEKLQSMFGGTTGTIITTQENQAQKDKERNSSQRSHSGKRKNEDENDVLTKGQKQSSKTKRFNERQIRKSRIHNIRPVWKAIKTRSRVITLGNLAQHTFAWPSSRSYFKTKEYGVWAIQEMSTIRNVFKTPLTEAGKVPNLARWLQGDEPNDPNKIINAMVHSTQWRKVQNRIGYYDTRFNFAMLESTRALVDNNANKKNKNNKKDKDRHRKELEVNHYPGNLTKDRAAFFEMPKKSASGALNLGTWKIALLSLLWSENILGIL